MTQNSPLIAHVHVPKTAGTTINAALAATLGPGRDHIQALIRDRAALADTLSGARWVAGHVPLPVLRTALAEQRVSARFVTALRAPVAHVASHYNWLIEIGHRGRAFLQGHPPEIRDIHLHLRNTDNSNPAAVIANLETYAGLFLNCQARHVIGRHYALAETAFLNELDAYDTVVFSDDVRAGLARFLPGRPADPATRNQSRYHFDPAIFDHPALRTFLMDRNRADETLWAVANARFRPAQPRQEIAA
ncbi:hypothetical protein [Actibacterium ureilyticum]|uniref:hypothetical protein n=1 Tax=Actibacterium ureilyticum TaxID=1590614 RepID=UPI000BAAD47C|nr:hypothetical protein [Actibacterium ureilyticum]